MIADIFYLLGWKPKFWSVEDNRYSIITYGRLFLCLLLVIFRDPIPAGNKKYDVNCVFYLSKVSGKLVDAYSLYFNFSFVIFWINQEECFILLIDNTVPYKSKYIKCLCILFRSQSSRAFELLNLIIDFIVEVLHV